MQPLLTIRKLPTDAALRAPLSPFSNVTCNAFNPNKSTGMSIEDAQAKHYGDDDNAVCANGGAGGDDPRHSRSKFMAGNEDFFQIAFLPHILAEKGKSKALQSPSHKAACAALNTMMAREDTGHNPDHDTYFEQMSGGGPCAAVNVTLRAPRSPPSRVAPATSNPNKKSGRLAKAA